VEYTTIN
jgi:hypothetical protein